jgi:hypothetical protein
MVDAAESALQFIDGRVREDLDSDLLLVFALVRAIEIVGRSRLFSDPAGTLHRFADLLQVDHGRIRLWTFARLAVESSWETTHGSEALTKKIAL